MRSSVHVTRYLCGRVWVVIIILCLHNAAIIATCVRVHNSNFFHALLLFCALTQVAMIAALCTPPAPVLILSWLVVVVVGVACCCCIPFRLALMLVLTFAPCACSGGHWQQFTVVVFLPQPLAQTPLAPAVVSLTATCTGIYNIYIYISVT